MGLRRTARECVLQILFQAEFEKDVAGKTPMINVSTEEKMIPGVKVFADQLLEGVRTHREEIDLIIKNYSENWASDRLAKVDRNILRFSIFEILYREDIPAKVTINEAIEIAKRYGNEHSGGFINGILDRIQLDRSNSGVLQKTKG